MGVRHASLGLALWELQAERTTGNQRSVRQHTGLSSQHTGDWSVAGSQAHEGYFFSALKSRTIPTTKVLVPKERNQNHVRKISSQVRQ